MLWRVVMTKANTTGNTWMEVRLKASRENPHRDTWESFTKLPTWWGNLWRLGWWKSPTSSPASREGPSYCVGRPSVSWHHPRLWPSARAWLGCLGTVGLSARPPDASSQTAAEFQNKRSDRVNEWQLSFCIRDIPIDWPRHPHRASSCREQRIWSEQPHVAAFFLYKNEQITKWTWTEFKGYAVSFCLFFFFFNQEGIQSERPKQLSSFMQRN